LIYFWFMYYEIMLQNHKVTFDNMAKNLKWVCSRDSIHIILTDVLKYRKLSARWVPKMLTAEHREKSVECAQSDNSTHRAIWLGCDRSPSVQPWCHPQWLSCVPHLKKNIWEARNSQTTRRSKKRSSPTCVTRWQPGMTRGYKSSSCGWGRSSSGKVNI